MKRTTWRRSFAVVLTTGVLLVGCSRTETSTGGSTGGGSTPGGTNATGGTTGPFIDPAADCKDYKGTAGVSGDTIKVGTIRPASGPYAIYDQVTAGIEAYFKAKNDAGGIKAGDGKSYKVELVKGDDGYDPGKTLGEAKKLIEQEGAFGLVGVIGTEGNLAIRQYMNDGCIPNISLATGSPEWGAADKYPWYISALPSYATEAHGWAEYLKKAKPDAKVALLYQDDDFGKSYQSAFKKGIAGSKINVVAEQSFNPLSGGTTEAAVTSLSQSGADVFIIGIGGTPCPNTIKFMPATWKPMTFISVTCQSKIALSLAGDNAVGVYSAQVTYDASDPADKDIPKVKEFVTEGLAGGLTQSQIEGGISSAGWGMAALFGKSLELSKTVDRASVMNTLFAMKDANYGLIRDGITVNTNGSTDPWGVEGFRIVQRTADGWKEVQPVINYEGQSNSFAG